jgi:hypothetical protein
MVQKQKEVQNENVKCFLHVISETAPGWSRGNGNLVFLFIKNVEKEKNYASKHCATFDGTKRQ